MLYAVVVPHIFTWPVTLTLAFGLNLGRILTHSQTAKSAGQANALAVQFLKLADKCSS